MNARDTFTSVVKGKNMFTPSLEVYYKIPNGAIELSSYSRKMAIYSDFMKGCYGVTVVLNGEHATDKCQLFNNFQEAIDYIKSFNPTSRQHYERYNAYGDVKLVTNKI